MLLSNPESCSSCESPCLYITEPCVARMKELRAKNEKYQHLKVLVDAGGCSGFSYNLEMTDSIHSDDM